MTPEQTQEEWEDEIISDSCFHQEGKKMQLKLRSIVRTARLKAVAQFDAMLAEDITEIEIMIDILHSRPRNSYENGVWVALTKAKSILEARRLSLKK